MIRYRALTLDGETTDAILRRWVIYPHPRTVTVTAEWLVEVVLASGGIFDVVGDEDMQQLEAHIPIGLDTSRLRTCLEARHAGIIRIVRKRGRKSWLTTSGNAPQATLSAFARYRWEYVHHDGPCNDNDYFNSPAGRLCSKCYPYTRDAEIRPAVGIRGQPPAPPAPGVWARTAHAGPCGPWVQIPSGLVCRKCYPKAGWHDNGVISMERAEQSVPAKSQQTTVGPTPQAKDTSSGEKVYANESAYPLDAQVDCKNVPDVQVYSVPGGPPTSIFHVGNECAYSGRSIVG